MKKVTQLESQFSKFSCPYAYLLVDYHQIFQACVIFHRGSNGGNFVVFSLIYLTFILAEPQNQIPLIWRIQINSILVLLSHLNISSERFCDTDSTGAFYFSVPFVLCLVSELQCYYTFFLFRICDH